MIRPDIHDILSGIGQTEDSGGWWETSTGAEFGQRKMQEIEACVDAAVAAERERCAKVAFGFGAVDMLAEHKPFSIAAAIRRGGPAMTDTPAPGSPKAVP